jgi:hypothetical protein
LTVIVEIPMVCERVAAGLGTLGVVIFWARHSRAVNSSSSVVVYLIEAGFGIFKVRLNPDQFLASWLQGVFWMAEGGQRDAEPVVEWGYGGGVGV